MHEVYGANDARLASMEARHDPDNLFRANQNIARPELSEVST